jgi:hypothetical protein
MRDPFVLVYVIILVAAIVSWTGAMAMNFFMLIKLTGEEVRRRRLERRAR